MNGFKKVVLFLKVIVCVLAQRRFGNDIDKYWYSGHGTGFDRQTSFSYGNETGKNVISFGVEISSSSKIDNRKKDILILGKGPT